MSDSVPPTPQDTANLSVNTGGGAFIHGNVNTGDDAFIGRDQIAVTINNIVQGINDLPTRYDGVVRNFLEYYLGSAAQPAPFGGRDDALAMLDRWLTDPHAPHYALLAAPAGRGKSSLLAHWVSHLAQREDIHVVYFPISIRFNSNRDNVVFAALAARIAHIYGEKMTRANDAQEYRGVFVDYLRRTPPNGKPLLVVLDGLDEAAGWEIGSDLFPLIPSRYLRVIVAARLLANDPRGQGWLTQLGWEKPGTAQMLALAGLDRKGIEDVLEKMGNPLDQLTIQIDIVTQLHKLSEGDPLLVRLYVEALLPYGNQAATLHPEELLILQPGLKAYFDQWFKGQEALWKITGTIFDRRCVNTLLDLCAMAFGPLSKEDVLALAPDRFEDSHSLALTVNALNRLLIGDGSVASGYIFSHPRLHDYFSERLTSSERKHWLDRFLSYGRQTLVALVDGNFEPNEASPYIVRYYGVHLLTANAQASAFYDLICEQWLRAWEWVDGTPDGFLSNVQEAWRQAEKNGADALGQMICCALCFSSVTSIGTNISTQLLTASVNAGLVSPQLALVMARLKSDLEERAKCLIAISSLLPNEIKQITLNEALASVYLIGHKRDQFDVLLSITKRMPTNERTAILEKILTIVRSMESDETRCNALLAIIDLLTPNQRATVVREALAAARMISDAKSRTWALKTIADELIDDQQLIILAEVLDSTRMIDDKKNRFQILNSLCQCLPSDQYLSPLLDEMLDVAYTIEDEISRAEALCILSTYLSPNITNLWNKIQDTVRTIRNEIVRISTLCTLYSRLPNATQLWSEVLDVTREIKDDKSRFQVLRILIRYMSSDAQQAVLAEALTIAQLLKDKDERVQALIDLVEFLPPNGQTVILREVLAIARTSFSETRCFRIVQAIVARLQPHQQDTVLAETLSVAQMIDNPELRIQMLVLLAKLLPAGQQLNVLNEALSTINNIESKWSRAHAIYSLLPAVHNIWHKTVEIVRTLDDIEIHCSILYDIANQLPFDQRPSVLAEALILARIIGDEEERTALLTVVARYLPVNEQQSILSEALAVAHFIREQKNRLTSLISLVTHLPIDQKLLVLAEVLEEMRTGDADIVDIHLLSSVAELLPKEATHLWTELLITINSIDDIESRIKALGNIAEYLPPNRKSTILSEALDYARSIDDSETRINALINIVWSFPPVQRASILIEVLTLALKISKKDSRSRVLKVIKQYFPFEIEDLPTSNIQTQERDIGEEEAHGWALRTVAEYLSHDGIGASGDAMELWTELLTLVRSIDNQWNRSEIIRVIAEYLPCEAANLWNELLSLIRVINDREKYSWILDIPANRYMPFPLKLSVLTEALIAARSIDDLDKRAVALSIIVKHLPKEPSTLDLELFEDACDMCQHDESFLILEILAHRWESMCKTNGKRELDLVAKVLHTFANTHRAQLLSAIKAVMPVIARLGGERVVRETAEAIIDTAKWWP